MYLFEVSVLLLSIASYGHTSNSNSHSNLQQWQHTVEGVNDQPENKKNCICYPDGPPPTVHDVLDPSDNGQERLIIYLYKNIDSNDIKIYIPSNDKQMFIPDLPYEANDNLLIVNTETIATVFYNSPHRIKVYGNRFENNTSVVDSWPIGLNIGEVETIYPNDGNSLNPNNNNGPKENENIHIQSNEHVQISTNGPQDTLINNLPGYANQNTWLSPVEYNNETPEITKTPVWSYQNNYLYKNPQIQPEKNHPGAGGIQNLVYSFQTNGLITLPSSSSTQDLNNPLSSQYITFTSWYNQQMERFQDIQLPTDIQVLDYNVLRILVVQTLAENDIHVSSDGVMVDSKGIVLEPANLELRPMLLGERIEEEILRNPPNIITLPKDLPYLEGILVTFVNPPQILGIIPLGKTYLTQTQSIQNSLHNIYGNIDKYTYLSESNEPLKTTKEARTGADTGLPWNMYSGGYGEYSNLYSDVQSYTPAWSPNSYPTIINQEPYSTGNGQISYWNNGPYSTPTKEPINWTTLPNSGQLGQRRKFIDAKIEHHYEPPTSKTKKKKNKNWHSKSKKHIDHKRNELNENSTPNSLIDEDSLGSGRRLSSDSLKSVMNTLLYLLDKLPSRREFGSSDNSTEPEETVNGSERLNSGDQPDFRIIGGNAATGSGTPVSNKGRSGHYEEYI